MGETLAVLMAYNGLCMPRCELIKKLNRYKMKKVIVGKSKGLADSKQCDIHIVGKRYSFKERTPKIGDYISMFWNDGSDCECVYNGLDKNIKPLPDGWYYVD